MTGLPGPAVNQLLCVHLGTHTVGSFQVVTLSDFFLIKNLTQHGASPVFMCNPFQTCELCKLLTRDDIQSNILSLMYGTYPKLCPYSARTLTIFTGSQALEQALQIGVYLEKCIWDSTYQAIFTGLAIVHLATTCRKICEHHVSYTSDMVVQYPMCKGYTLTIMSSQLHGGSAWGQGIATVGNRADFAYRYRWHTHCVQAEILMQIQNLGHAWGSSGAPWGGQ